PTGSLRGLAGRKTDVRREKQSVKDVLATGVKDVVALYTSVRHRPGGDNPWRSTDRRVETVL
ncbi:MAG: hypothetical protein WCA15_17595, partial [Candidatus Acidiferrales bacterium]